VPPSSGQEDLNDITDVDKLIDTADRLNQEGQFEAASVVLWIALETSLRVLLTHRQSRPNPGVSGFRWSDGCTRMLIWMTPILIS
jgi:hypothetical protein